VGSILFEITQSSILITLKILVEAIGAVNNLNKVFQTESLRLSSVPMLVSSSISHLQNISGQCVLTDDNNFIRKKIKSLKDHISTSRSIVQNENKIKSLRETK